MTYFCFIESENLGTPHMEPLDASNAQDALAEARRLTATHARAVGARVFLDDDCVGTITPGAA